MELPVVADAERHGKLIGYFAPQGFGLGKGEVMGFDLAAARSAVRRLAN